jgi:sulfatase maturation enzyme AslB (radical SAM superfamily)
MSTVAEPTLADSITASVQSGELTGRIWFYSNYHCNLACTYCFTESSPSAPKRALPPEQIVDLARQAKELGFDKFGLTGGEPFLMPYIVDVAKELGALGPTILITNGTVFGPKRFARATELAGHDVALQISLDAPDPVLNDEMRGPENFAKVADVIPRLTAEGVRVRIATTIEEDRLDTHQHSRLCDLHRSWGVVDEDHIVRPIVTRGRAVDEGMGTELTYDQFPPELSVSVDGAYWGAFGPSFQNGIGDTDLLLTRTIDPISVPAAALHRIASGRPHGADSALGIR